MRRALASALGVLSIVTLSADPSRADCTAHGDAPAIPQADAIPGQSNPPQCAGGGQLVTRTVAGESRTACVYLPNSAIAANTTSPLPLVVYLHPSLFTADTLEFATNVLEYQNSANLSDDSSRPGFLLVAPEGRNTNHYYPSPDDKGTGWDNWYRNTDPNDPAENVDIRTIDDFIAYMQATYAVDSDRIFVTGWSNGSAMAYLYGLMRPSIASVAVYSAPDPFAAFNDPCKQTPVAHAPADDSEIQIANVGLPVMHVHNDCDIAGLCPNGERLERRLSTQGVFIQDAVIDSAMLPANGCLDACGTDPDADANPGTSSDPMKEATSLAGISLGTGNHVRWPQGWTLPMLDFFRTHPRSARAH